MTTATVHDFVEELKKLNPGKAEFISVGRGIDCVRYTGGDPRELIPPELFNWDEEYNGFSDRKILEQLNRELLIQVFVVVTDD